MDVRVGQWRKLSAKELMLWTVLLEKTLERHLNFKEIKPVNPKGNQPWIFTGRTDPQAEASIPCPLDVKTWLIGKGLNVGKVQFSHSVTSDSLWPHGLQHARPPCPSLTPRVYPNSYTLSRWCHPTISSSVVPFSTCPQSFPASGSFPVSQLFISDGQVLEFQPQH